MKRMMTALLGMGIALSAMAQNPPPPQPIATIDKITGKVMVNEGKAFAPGRLQQRLKPGDRVMVMDKSRTTIVFDDDCRLDIEANKLVVVPDRSTCAGGYLAEQGIEVERVNKVAQGRPHIVDKIKDGEIALIFNTTEGWQSLKDSEEIRKSALVGKVAQYTTAAGSIAAAQAIAALKHAKLEVRPLQDYY